MSTVASVVNLGGRKCDKLATVVGRQFITLSVHLCVQHDEREAARGAGLSAAAETFPATRSQFRMKTLLRVTVSITINIRN